MKQARADWHEGHHVLAVRGFVARHWPSIAFIITLLLFGWVTYKTIDVNDQIREGLITNCEKTRTPLEKYFESEVATTKATDPSLFPDIPPTLFEKLIAEKVDRITDVIVVFDPDKCADVYK